ncbi:DUF11 domain-containing protein [Candidatus Nomurabacteria bacterium]|nr:DUF11 domain-containing protein [Candidatus Nomurabacteria bacterium]
MKIKKSKKILIVILVIAAILGASAIGISYYFSSTSDITPQQSEADLASNKCNDIYLKTKDGTALIEDENDPLYDGPIVLDPAVEIVIGADFQTPNPETGSAATYTTFEFTINEKKYTVESTTVEPKQSDEFFHYFPETTFKDFGTEDTLRIVVNALDSDGNKAVEGCAKIYDVKQEKAITKTESCLDAGATGSKATDGDICCEGLEKANCTVPDNSNQCTLETDADCFICIKVDTKCGIGENHCNSPDDCPVPKATEETTTTDSTPTDTTTNTGKEETATKKAETTTKTTVDNSDFSITKDGTECVERVSGSDKADFTITVKNNADSTEGILKIVDKLPLGFTYVKGSTKINGISDSNDQNTAVTSSGESEEVIWTQNSSWNVKAGEKMTIEFSALAGTNALTGDVINEVVITPLNIPTDASALKATFTFKVAQTCEVPKTGLFDKTQTKIIAGAFTLFMAALFYFTTVSDRVTEKVLITKTGKFFYRGLKLLNLKVTNPREYFETRFEESERKKRSKNS